MITIPGAILGTRSARGCTTRIADTVFAALTTGICAGALMSLDTNADTPMLTMEGFVAGVLNMLLSPWMRGLAIYATRGTFSQAAVHFF